MNYLNVGAIASAMVAFLMPQLGGAAEWRPVSLTATAAGSSTPYKSYMYAGTSFFDDSYSLSLVLSDSSNLSDTPSFLGEYREIIYFPTWMGAVGAPPFVDVQAQTIDVSAIWKDIEQADVSQDVWICEGKAPCYQGLVWNRYAGGDFGPLDPVPYVANPGNTYTATWNFSAPRLSGMEMFGRMTQISFTFASAVPEPHQGGLLSTSIVLVVAARMLGSRRAGMRGARWRAG